MFANYVYLYYKNLFIYAVVKTMPDEDFCEKCVQRQSCKTVYEQICKQKTPSVTIEVIFAFLLPILIFIASLAVFRRVLKNLIATEKWLTAAAFLLALLITFVYLPLAKKMNKNRKNNSSGHPEI